MGRASIEALALRSKTFFPWLIVFALGLVVLKPGSLPIGAILVFALASLLAGARVLPIALLQARLRFAAVGVAMSVGRWITAGTTFAVFAVPPADRLTVLGLAAALGEAGTIAIASAFLLTSGDESSRGSGRINLRTTAPFAINTVLGLTYNRLDVLIVAALTSAVQLAAYAPASRLQDALYVLPTALGAVALPLVAAAWRGGDGAREVDRLVRRLIFGGMALALPMAALTCIFAPQIIHLVLGANYEDATTPTRVLVWFLPFSVISAPPLAGLAALGRARDTVIVFGATFVAAIVGLALFVPWFGAVGGATGSLLRDLVGATVSIGLARRAGLLGGHPRVDQVSSPPRGLQR
jgi:O-antigen/teichoic acid export membrane protein